MSVNEIVYHLDFKAPEHHQVFVRIELEAEIFDNNELTLFMPSWSPGSYLMREYARNVRCVQAQSDSGEFVYCQQSDKGKWTIDLAKSELKSAAKTITFQYQVYCHELTVRTSHVDASHAFIHGPSVFMGVEKQQQRPIKLHVKIPAAWSKIATGLKDVSIVREEFVFAADDYDQFVDAPLEIGCHFSDGFMLDGKAHELAFYGDCPRQGGFAALKDDIKKIVEHISKAMGGMPYQEKYTFITHFVPGKFGGLEHLNSTALHFCPLKLADKKMYLKWLELVAHEYFHTWNVKRIRPVELGPFDYTREAMTRMHWLTEGLTSFMDQLFIYRCGFASLEDYMEMMKENFNRYLGCLGRRFHSLEDSSYNAWLVLYRPDENSSNSSISYYLKGGLVFFALHLMMAKKSVKIDDLLKLLWKRYLEQPQKGVESSEVLAMIEDLAGADVRSSFEVMLQTTEEIDFEKLCSEQGMKWVWSEKSEAAWIGFQQETKGSRLFVKSVTLDGPFYRAGVNAGDELIAINHLRVDTDNFSDHLKSLGHNKNYKLTISRLGVVQELEFQVASRPRQLEKIEVLDAKKVAAIFQS